jgi:hypothetical protein
MKRIFLSEGLFYISNIMPRTPPEEKNIFPFLKVNFTAGPSGNIDSWTRGYPSKLYTIFDENALSKVKDIKNRTQAEQHIQQLLELYLISYLLIYDNPVQFIFKNTTPIAKKEVPPETSPLPINGKEHVEDLYKIAEEISSGQIDNIKTNKSTEKDLSFDKFTLVKPTNHGYSCLVTPYCREGSSGNILTENVVKNIEKHSPELKTIKALDFYRRGSVLERLKFCNEAFLNYFKAIESLTNEYKERKILKFMINELSISKANALRIIKTRGEIVAHGKTRKLFFREVGQLETFTLRSAVRKYLFTLLH